MTDYGPPEARGKAELKLALSRNRCNWGIGFAASTPTRCKQRCQVGSLLCSAHRVAVLALIKARQGSIA